MESHEDTTFDLSVVSLPTTSTTPSVLEAENRDYSKNKGSHKYCLFFIKTVDTLALLLD